MPEQNGTQPSYDFFPDRRSIINEASNEELPMHEYVELVIKYLSKVADVCAPCTEARIKSFARAPLVWAVRHPSPIDVITRIDQDMPCAHHPDELSDEDITARITARIAMPREVTVELV